MPESQYNPGWEPIWILEAIYVSAPNWQGQYPSLPEAHAALRHFEINHREKGLRRLTISEGRIKKSPFLRVDL